MNAVSKRTGLSPHVIRVWERRYRAVQPMRSDGNRRVYSEEDIARLILFRQLTEAGHRISDLARYSTAELETLQARNVQAAPDESDQKPVREAILAVKNLDRAALEESLRRGAVAFGAHGLLERVVAPLTERIGELWRRGELTAAHEHFASAAIRQFLGSPERAFVPGANAPDLIVTTPAGQIHELGAVIVAAAAADLGWHVTYLGPSLPPEEIAAAAAQNRSRAVALSIVYPEDDSRLPGELLKLRALLPAGTALLAGGRAAPAYSSSLSQIGAVQPASLAEFCSKLDELRRNAPSAKP